MVDYKFLRPKNLQIIVQKIDIDYKTSLKHNHYWYNNDLVITHFFNALQTTFPEGEIFCLWRNENINMNKY